MRLGQQPCKAFITAASSKVLGGQASYSMPQLQSDVELLQQQHGLALQQAQCRRTS